MVRARPFPWSIGSSRPRNQEPLVEIVAKKFYCPAGS